MGNKRVRERYAEELCEGFDPLRRRREFLQSVGLQAQARLADCVGEYSPHGISAICQACEDRAAAPPEMLVHEAADAKHPEGFAVASH